MRLVLCNFMLEREGITNLELLKEWYRMYGSFEMQLLPYTPEFANAQLLLDHVNRMVVTSHPFNTWVVMAKLVKTGNPWMLPYLRSGAMIGRDHYEMDEIELKAFDGHLTEEAARHLSKLWAAGLV